jgi:GNAT superfamily N-acetyltransferase
MPDDGVIVRSAFSQDVEQLARLHRRTVIVAYDGIFPAESPPPSDETLRCEWRRVLEQASARVFCAAADAELIGVVMAERGGQPDDSGEVTRLLVDPEHWRVGVGSRLLHAAISWLRDCSDAGARLWVLADNTRARRFYEGRGWTLQPGSDKEPWPGVHEVRYTISFR